MAIKTTIDVTDAREIAGVEYACSVKNATIDEGETPLTSEGYIQFVMASALADWADQKERADKLAAAGL